MANTFAPSGFRQLSGTGSSPTFEQNVGWCAYNASAAYFGDPLFQNADGSATVGTPGTGQLAGIFVGCKYLSVSQKRTIWNNYWPGSDVASSNTVEVYFVNDPNAKFVAQVGVSSTGTPAATTADIGANVQFAYGTASTASGISGAYVDYSTTPTTTATLPFKVVGLVTSPPGANGTESGNYNLVIVAFNNVSTKTLTGI